MTQTHCAICARPFWRDGCEQLAADERFCVACVVAAAETTMHKNPPLCDVCANPKCADTCAYCGSSSTHGRRHP